jgi:hypothetical protein
MTTTRTSTEGVPAGPAVAADLAGLPRPTPDFTFLPTRRFTMFHALYTDLARSHRRRRQREFQRQLEQRAQQETLRQMPRMLAR